jgi:hypothetical protein
MPKPVKKAATKKRTTAKKPASDPNRRARQFMDEHMDQLAAGKWGQMGDSESGPELDVTPPHGDPFEAMYRQRTSELGKKAGPVSGAKQMEMPQKQRRDIALKAAKARWANKKGQERS